MNPALSLTRFRRPEYTGENRCIPCTITNVTIALVGSAAVAAFWFPAGAVVFALSLLAIYLRGYLVPGTPAITERYFPESVLRAFEGGEPESQPIADQPSPAPDDPFLDDPESLLLAADAIEPCPEDDDLCLTPDFRRAWHEHIDTVRTDGSEKPILRELLNVDEAIQIDDENPDDVVMAHTETRPIGYWESRAALLADLGAVLALSVRYEGWAALSVEARSQAVNSLRIFLDRCPTCDGEITTGETVVRSCCRSHDVLAVSCVECGARILEVDAPDVGT